MSSIKIQLIPPDLNGNVPYIGSASDTNAANPRYGYRHDKRGNLVVLIDPDDFQIHYYCDEQGLLHTIKDARGGYKHLAWNRRAQLTAYTDCSGKTTRLAYDARGALIRVVDAAQHETAYEVDVLGRVSAIITADGARQSFRYDSAGRLIELTDANGRRTHYELNPRRSPACTRASSSEPQVLHKRWQYDPVGEVVNKTHNRYGETRYGYDPTGRIEHAFGAGLPAQMFRWDEAANLVSGSHPGGYVEHNRLKMFEDKRFEYNVYGRLIRKLTGRGPYKEQKFEYDAAHRLTKVTTLERNTIATIRFEYDALGRRIRKTNGYVGTDFLWDGMRLLQESRGDDEVTYLYEPESYVPLARIDSQAVQAANDDVIETTKTEGIYYFHNDVSGLPEELTDVEGHVVWQAQYRVWGSTVREEWTVAEEEATVVWTSPGTVREAPLPQRRTPLPQNLRFQGQYLDRESGLHYNTFRFYDPDIGRFITA